MVDDSAPSIAEANDVLEALRVLGRLRGLGLDDSLLTIGAARLTAIAKRGGFTRVPLPYPESEIVPQTAIRWLETFTNA